MKGTRSLLGEDSPGGLEEDAEGSRGEDSRAAKEEHHRRNPGAPPLSHLFLSLGVGEWSIGVPGNHIWLYSPTI
jgi:hypothetical protein